VEEEEVLFAADFAVVAFGGFGEQRFVFGHLFLVGETDAVDPLEGIVLCITKPVRRGILLLENSFEGESTFITEKALILPVWGMCGPVHRSISGPHR
jgi:hypothetical protein